MLVYKHLSTFQCSFMFPRHHTISLGLCPNACTQASEHFQVLIHCPNVLYYKIRTCTQMLVYKNMSTFQCSFMFPIVDTVSFRFAPRFLYTCIWAAVSGPSCSKHIIHPISFGLAPKCLYTSIWALVSAHSWSQYIILEVSDLCPTACIQASDHSSSSFIVPIYYTRSFGLVPKCLYTSIWTLVSAHSWSQYSIL